jgi:hypothetical protein
MSTASSAGARTDWSERAAAREADDHGRGWTGFAGAMLAIIGTLNVIYGIAAIDDANVYVGDTRYVFGDLSLWGWFLLGVGTVQFVAAFGIWSGAQWARWVGVLSATGNAMLQLLFLPALPLLSMALFAVDVLVIYALIQYGGRRQTAA